MAPVFDTTCRNCSAKTSYVSDCLSLRVCGKDVAIPHPCESENTKKHGVTLEEAAFTGRLRLNTAYACRQCGKVWYPPAVELPGEYDLDRTTKVVMTLLFVAVYVCIRLLGLNTWWMLPAVVLLAIGAVPIHRRRIRRRALKAHGIPSDTRCQACESTDTVDIGTFVLEEEGVMLCDNCGARERVCDEDGMWMS